MKITATSGTGAAARTVVLGDDRDKVATISGWMPADDFIEQEVPLPRAPSPARFDRLNVTTQSPFRATRTFEDYAKAASFIRNHMLEVPRIATVTFEGFGDYGPNLVLRTASIRKRVVQFTGACVIFEYLIKGGQFEAQINSNQVGIE